MGTYPPQHLTDSNNIVQLLIDSIASELRLNNQHRPVTARQKIHSAIVFAIRQARIEIIGIRGHQAWIKNPPYALHVESRHRFRLFCRRELLKIGSKMLFTK